MSACRVAAGALLRSRDASTSILTILSFALPHAMLLAVAGGVSAFRERAAAGVGADPDLAQLYIVFAGFAAVLLIVPILTMGAAAARLGMTRRAENLAILRLIGLSPSAARLACVRGSDLELEEICRRAQEVARAIRAGEDFSQAEENFHLAFVMAAHNRVMSQLLPIIHNALHETWAALDVMSLLGKLTLQDNEVLLGFLRQRDGEGAQYAMATHIRHTINVLNLPPQDGTILD